MGSDAWRTCHRVSNKRLQTASLHVSPTIGQARTVDDHLRNKVHNESVNRLRTGDTERGFFSDIAGRGSRRILLVCVLYLAHLRLQAALILVYLTPEKTVCTAGITNKSSYYDKYKLYCLVGL